MKQLVIPVLDAELKIYVAGMDMPISKNLIKVRYLSITSYF